MAATKHRLRCPLCKSHKIWKDGIRYTKDCEVQRYLCKCCGHRFSDPNQNRKQRLNTLNRSQHAQKIQSLNLKTSDAILTSCQVGACGQSVAKNLVKVETRSEKRAAGATEQQQEKKKKIVEFLWYLQRMGRTKQTIRQYSRILKRAAEKVDIFEPEMVKRFIADSKISRTTKANLTNVFKSFYKFLKISWEPPEYKPEKTIPFIPTEQELDLLISNGSKIVSAFLQILKDTGMRRGEALNLEWDDIDFERRVVRIKAEKNSYPRVLPLSRTAITYLQRLPKKQGKIFNRTSVTTTFYRLRKRLVHKLQNPRIQKIGFHTFRHWKATMEYHKTKDILHVKEMLGHKSIQNTLIYINIERALFQKQNDEFHVKTARNVEEAKELIEVGFEYVCEINGCKLFRKRK